jgi:dihydroxyacid dehydratase/phosphogluconate dehydratase
LPAAPAPWRWRRPTGGRRDWTYSKKYGSVEIRAMNAIQNSSRPVGEPLMVRAGFGVSRGNLFDSAIIKTSVIGPDFRQRYLSNPEDPGHDASELRCYIMFRR